MPKFLCFPSRDRIQTTVISGFNTDVEFNGVVYHIQTEDKGLPSKKIISLVYDRGTILASKRTTYEDLENGNLDEKVLAERVGKQHRLMCAAIKAGRIDELKRMTADASAARSGKFLGVVEEKSRVKLSPPPIEPESQSPTEAVVDPPKIADPFLSPPEKEDPPIPEPTSLPDGAADTETLEVDAGWILLDDEEEVVIEKPAEDPFEDFPLIEAVSVIEDEPVYQAEAVEIVSELSGRERPANLRLGIELLGEFKFKGGDRQTVSIMVCRGTARKVVPNAQIMVKVLGSTFRPVIFHAKTDSNGLAKVHLQVPHFNAGRAALLIRAVDMGEEIELRRIVLPG